MVRVKLLTNLTNYDKRLIVGEIGNIINMFPSRGDRFATAKFNNGACLDVLWEGFKIIDEEYVQKNYRNRQDRGTKRSEDGRNTKRIKRIKRAY